jgi:hypothetical protein
VGGHLALPLFKLTSNKMKTTIFSISLIIVFLIPGLALAQMFSGPPSFSPDVLDNPIDGGLGLLLGSGVIYGAKKLRDFRRNQIKKEED